MWPAVVRDRARAMFALAAAAGLGAVVLYVGARGPRTRALAADVVVPSAAIPPWVSQGPSRRIAGQVIDGAGRGTPATVHVRLDVPDPRVWRGVDVETDADGTFEVEALPAGRYQLVVLGAVVSDLVQVDTTTVDQLRVAVIVEPCEPRASRIVVEGDAGPVVGATIEIAGIVVATSDARGQVRWCSDTRRGVAVVRAAGFLPTFEWFGPQRDLDVRLRPLGAHSRPVRMVAKDGTVLRRTAITPQFDSSQQINHGGVEPIPLQLITDDVGLVDLGMAEPGAYQDLAVQLLDRRSRHDAPAIVAGGEARLSSPHRPWNQVRGRVLLDGRPVPGAMVRCSNHREGTWAADSTRSDLDGRFELASFSITRLECTAQAPLGPTLRAFNVVLYPGQRATLDVELQRDLPARPRTCADVPAPPLVLLEGPSPALPVIATYPVDIGLSGHQRASGFELTQVDSPATGLRAGDVVTLINGIPRTLEEHLDEYLERCVPLHLEVQRDGKTLHVTIPPTL